MSVSNRIRPSALHRRFWDITEVRADEAMLDKCDVVIGGWSFDASGFETSQLVPRLSRLEVSCSDGSSTRLFEERTADDDRYSHTITVRGTGEGEGVRYPCPTFSGYLKIREVRNSRDGTSNVKTWEAIFFAYLNLNRSLRAQDLTSRAFVRGTEWVRHQHVLAMSDDARSRIRETVLSPCDNILDRSARRTRYALSRPVEQHLTDHVLAIFDTIERELRVRCGCRKVLFQRDPTVVLRTLEVCWDFFDEQPILAVLAMKNKVQMIAQTLKARYLPAFRLEEGLN